MSVQRLISYIAPGAPATRRSAQGDELFLRPEVGFTPRWYHDALGIDFGRYWHTDVRYRRETVLADIDSGTPDQRVLDAILLCAELSRVYGAKNR